eukprot:304236_1
MAVLFIVLLLLKLCFGLSSEAIDCDILIAGGNTGALSAAITAAQLAESQNQSISICLLEPTDWPGGQLSAEGVSAIDYGPYNGKAINQPKSFQSLINSMSPNGSNIGNCGESTTCYQPQNLINKWILPMLSNLSQYIKFYDRTVIKNTFNSTYIDNNTKKINKYITSVSAIQRKPKNISSEWTYLLSEQLTDWYSTKDSLLFTKTQYTFRSKVFIEATEFADIMLTSGIQVFQGVETPYENSTTTLDQCGSDITMTFFLKLLQQIPDKSQSIPHGNAEGFEYSFGNNWLDVWTYRRAYDGSGPNSPKNQINYNDITQENYWKYGNDYLTGYIFLPLKDAKSQVFKNNWQGGMNITAIAQAEQRSYGWFHYYVNGSSKQTLNIHFDSKQLIMDFNCTNTSIGFSKMPYMRDIRRPLGLFGFKLNHTTMLPIWNQTSKHGNYAVGYRFNDTIAIGNYPFDMHLLSSDKCENQYPQYIKSHSQRNVPYYIPFRCIGNNIYKNLLFGGKNIAQSFYANAATRLHPAEWNTGVAAGGAAYFMMENEINDTETVYNQIDKLQKLLQSDNINQPLDWN